MDVLRRLYPSCKDTGTDAMTPASRSLAPITQQLWTNEYTGLGRQPLSKTNLGGLQMTLQLFSLKKVEGESGVMSNTT
jgi:hypothetical protein